MWFGKDDGDGHDKLPDVDLYAVLNVNRGASQTEINERYRALSLLFHPDKQQSPERKEVAEEEYFKVQKAYQVLSDPFLRQVYDVLGTRGLSFKWPESLSSQSREKIDEELRRIQVNKDFINTFDNEPAMRTETQATLNAIQFFNPVLPPPPGSFTPTTLTWGQRLQMLVVVQDVFKHTYTKRVNRNTSVALETTGTSLATGAGHVGYVGTLRHQFSPRLLGQASFGFRRPYPLVLKGTYKDTYNELSIKGTAVPIGGHSPAVNVKYARRLFRKSPQVGEIALTLHRVPSLTMQYISPATMSEKIIQASQQGLPSKSGLQFYAFDKRFGIVVNDVLPKLTAEVGVTAVELSTRVKLGLEIGLTGSLITSGVTWAGERNQVGLETMVSAGGMMATFSFNLWNQRFSLPVVLASEWNRDLAVFALVLPSVVTTLSYHFVIRPRRRRRRIEEIRAARRAIEEDSDARRKREAVLDLLRDAANRSLSSETSKAGLIIQEASYGVFDEQSDAQNLAVDVTIPVQALVRNSQVYIPGGSSKSHLQGFSDPAPFTTKSLRVRYTFRGRPHYVEVPEYLPLVLPMSEHSVEEC